MADESCVHLVPVEGGITGERRGGLQRLRVAPNCVLGNAIPNPHRPVGGVALERAVGEVVGRFEEVLIYVLLREVVDGQVPRFMQDLDRTAVDNGLAVEDRTHPLGTVLEVESVGLQHRGVEVERAVALFAERAGSLG